MSTGPGPGSHRGLALAVLWLAAFTIDLDATVVTIALPPLVRQRRPVTAIETARTAVAAGLPGCCRDRPTAPSPATAS